MTYFQAIFLGLLQGVTELFPVSSLGHTVILPKLLGWSDVVAAQSAKESFFLAFLVGLHVATALALLVFYWRTWIDIIRGVLASLGRRRIETSTERLGWLLLVATIPAGLVGIVFEDPLRTLFATPLAAAAFLFLNGLVLATAEVYRRRAAVRAVAIGHGVNAEGARRLDTHPGPYDRSCRDGQFDGDRAPEGGSCGARRRRRAGRRGPRPRARPDLPRGVRRQE